MPARWRGATPDGNRRRDSPPTTRVGRESLPGALLSQESFMPALRLAVQGSGQERGARVRESTPPQSHLPQSNALSAAFGNLPRALLSNPSNRI